MDVEFNINKIRTRIEQIAVACGRDPRSIELLAVSKLQPEFKMRQAYDAGLRHFGENYLQEAMIKMENLSDLAITWHMIGRIQSNKAKAIAAHFDWVHTLDRHSIATRLSNARPLQKHPLNVCVEVNIDNEAQKGGVAYNDVEDFLTTVQQLPQLKVRGLMMIPAMHDEVALKKRPFVQLKKLFDHLNQRGHQLDTLSMGMTADYEYAIPEGATLIRIGEGIFGKRRQP